MPVGKKVHASERLIATTTAKNTQLQAIEDAKKELADLARKWREQIGQLALDAGLSDADDAIIPEVLRVGKIAVEQGLRGMTGEALTTLAQMMVYALKHERVYAALKDTIADAKAAQDTSKPNGQEGA